MLELRIYKLRNHFVSLLDILKDIESKVAKNNLKKTKTKKTFLLLIRKKLEKNLQCAIDWSLTYILLFLKHIKDPIEKIVCKKEQKLIKNCFKEVKKNLLIVYTTAKELEKIILYKMEKEEDDARLRLLKKIKIIIQESKAIYLSLEQKNKKIIKIYNFSGDFREKIKKSAKDDIKKDN